MNSNTKDTNDNVSQKSKAELKKERRELQEAQRLKKAQNQKSDIKNKQKEGNNNNNNTNPSKKGPTVTTSQKKVSYLEDKTPKNKSNSISKDNTEAAIDTNSSLLLKDKRISKYGLPLIPWHLKKVAFLRHIPSPNLCENFFDSLALSGCEMDPDFMKFSFDMWQRQCVMDDFERARAFAHVLLILVNDFELSLDYDPVTFCGQFKDYFNRHLYYFDEMLVLPVIIRSFIDYIKRDGLHDATIVKNRIKEFRDNRINVSLETIKNELGNYFCDEGCEIMIVGHSTLVVDVLRNMYAVSESKNVLIYLVSVQHDFSDIKYSKKMLSLHGFGVKILTYPNAFNLLMEKRVDYLLFSASAWLSNSTLLASRGLLALCEIATECGTSVIALVFTCQFWNRTLLSDLNVNYLPGPHLSFGIEKVNSKFNYCSLRHDLLGHKEVSVLISETGSLSVGGGYSSHLRKPGAEYQE